MKIKIENMLISSFFLLCFVIGTGKFIYIEYISILIIICGMVFDSRENILIYLAIFLPWYPSIGTKYAEIIVYSFILIYALRTKAEYDLKVDGSTIAFLFVGVISCILGLNNFDLVVQYAIPLVCLVFLAFQHKEKVDTIAISRWFAVSCILCALMACFGGTFPKLIKYSEQVVFYNVANYLDAALHGNVVRFSALDTDANFAAYNFLMASGMLLISNIKNNKSLSISDSLIIALSLIFGVFSISITYYILTVVFFGCVTFFADKKNGCRYVGIVFILGLWGYVLFKNQIVDIITVYNLRLNEADIGERSVIWLQYWNETIKSPLSIIWGNGAMAKLNITAHSTLVRSIYMYGIIGSLILLIFLIKHIFLKNIKGKIDLTMIPILITFIAFNLVLDGFRENGVYFFGFYLIMLYNMYGNCNKHIIDAN